MANLEAILTLNRKKQILKVANGLGFVEIRLFKAEEGALGICAQFKPEIDEDERNKRCLALTYKLSELTESQVVVVSNKHVRYNSIKKESVSLDDLSGHFSEVQIESNKNKAYEERMNHYKIIYDQLMGITPLKRKSDTPDVKTYLPSYKNSEQEMLSEEQVNLFLEKIIQEAREQKKLKLGSSPTE